MLHLADLSGPTKPWEICEQWTERIMEEFYEEGDEEKMLGLDLGALNDRETVVVPKAQVGTVGRTPAACTTILSRTAQVPVT